MSFRSVLIPLLFCMALMAGPVQAAPRFDATAFRLAYGLKPGEPLRYKLTATIHYNGPILDNPDPVDWRILVTLVYRATPKVRLADGTADVDLKVESCDVEVEKVPIPLDLKQVQEVLDQTATLTTAGEVKKITGSKDAPFSVSVPGVDPKRLFLLLFPIVFQPQPVRVGDNWSFKSDLLGGEGTNPSFSATILPSDREPKPNRAQRNAKEKTSKNSIPRDASGALTRLREEFNMPVDQKLDSDRKPVSGDAEVYRTRQGKIEGSGVFDFDRARGRFTSGTVHIQANIVESLVGKPQKEDEPRQTTSKVDANVMMELKPTSTTAASSVSEARKGR